MESRPEKSQKINLFTSEKLLNYYAKTLYKNLPRLAPLLGHTL